MLKFLHSDVIDLDFLVRGAHADTAATGVKGQVVGVALGLVEHADRVRGAVVEDPNRFVVGTGCYHAAIRGVSGQNQWTNLNSRLKRGYSLDLAGKQRVKFKLKFSRRI